MQVAGYLESRRLKSRLMLHSPPWMLEQVAERFHLAQTDRRVAGAAPILLNDGDRVNRHRVSSGSNALKYR